MSLQEIINVQITRQTTAVSRAGFGTPLVLDAHVNFTERSRIYTAASAMLDDGFESTDPAYIAVNAILSQNPKPSSVKVGRRQVDVIGISVDTAVDNTDYSVVINGTTFTFNSGVAATVVTIAAGIVAAVNAGAEPVTAGDDLDGTFTLTTDVAGTAFTATVVGANMSYEKPYAVVDSVADDLTAIAEVDNDWYTLLFTSRIQADVEAAALWIESQRKIFATASSNANILSAVSTTDVAYVLNAAGYDRTIVMYSATPETFPDAAWLGKQLPTDPGSTTWMFKQLATITADSLSPTQSTAARNKKCNTYETIAGVSITREGTVASGEFIDIIRGVDWLQARMEERIYSRLVNSNKIPFTDTGVSIIVAEIQAQLNQGIDNGLLATNPAYSITAPLVADVSVNDKANRLLPDIQFTAYLAGAIHAIQVNGTVTL